MGSGEKTLYPMLGVGAFFVMFWVGFVVGYELGLDCWLFLLNALFFACSGTWFVVRLESSDVCPKRPPTFDAAGAGRKFDQPRQPNFPHSLAPRAG